MSEDSHETLSQQELLQVNARCNLFEDAWRKWRDADSSSDQPRVEAFLSGDAPKLRIPMIRELASIEMEYRSASGETLMLSEYCERFSDVDSGIFINLLQESVSDHRASGDADSDLGIGDTARIDEQASKADASFSLGANVSSSTHEPNQIGQYEIVRVLGKGGMGTVYQAVHREMKRDVALKVMRSDLHDQESLKKRFRREVLAAAKLVHANIVTAYDAGETKGDSGRGGQPFLVSELVDGVDLKHHIKSVGAMSVTEALGAIRHAATGLQYAHQHDVIHRDIKPANLLIEKNGNVKILDMGLARLSFSNNGGGTGDTDIDPELTAQLTNTGAVMGTAGYMAPEQARNIRSADARSDVYSLGCVLFFLLQGRAPFRGESMVDTLLAHATEPIPELVDMPGDPPIGEDTKQLVYRMMAKSPAHRPQSMTEVIGEIDRITRKESEPSKPLAPPPVITSADSFSSHRSRQGNRVSSNTRSGWLMLVGTLAVLVGGMIALLGYFGGSGKKQGNQNSRPEDSPPQITPGNRAVFFNGDDSYLSAPSVRRGPGNELTMELITRCDGIRRPMNPLCWLGDDWTTLFYSGQWGIGRKQNGRSLFAIESSDSRVPVGQWVHIAGTWDGRELRLFVDGKPMAPDSINYTLGDTTPGLFIGGVDPQRLPDGQSNRFYHGVIDAARVVERVIYPADQTFTPPKRLERIDDTLVLYQFNEPEGSQSFADSSGNGHTAISSNARSVSMTP